MCLPYSPEYLPQKPGQGIGALERLAKSTGGCERVNLVGLWKDIPRKPRLVLLAPYLLLAAVMLFLLEIIERRTGVLSLRRRRTAVVQQEVPAKLPEKRAAPVAAHKAQHIAAPEEKKAPAASAPPPPADAAVGNESLTDVLGQAQRRARRRTERN